MNKKPLFGTSGEDHSSNVFHRIQTVFLGGGSCRIPCIQKQIKAKFPNAQIVIDEELETIVATGAAIRALQLSHNDTVLKLKNTTSNMTPLNSYYVNNCGNISVPRVIKEYESRTNIMGVDLGSSKSALAVSRNKEIHVVPFDNLSPEDLWTDSVVSFDEENPIIGKAALKKLQTRPASVVFGSKLLSNDLILPYSRNNLWPFKYKLSNGQEPFVVIKTSCGYKKAFLSEINKIFLDNMKNAAARYRLELNDKKKLGAVLTVPSYFTPTGQQESFIESVVKTARLSDVDIIDIIEETHADLLYYMSNDKYSRMIKPGTKIAIFDIGGGTSFCRVYKITQKGTQKVAEAVSIINCYLYGRKIDDIIMETITRTVQEYKIIDLGKNYKLRLLEVAKSIKHSLYFKDTVP